MSVAMAVRFEPLEKELSHTLRRHIEIDGIPSSDLRPPDELQHFVQGEGVLVKRDVLFFEITNENRRDEDIRQVGHGLFVDVVVRPFAVDGHKASRIGLALNTAFVGPERRPHIRL